ncbi:MAG: EAL domain-containing protein [Lachnospira sp.]|nr:EAL domain-containing protein [Lachnospira sp.]
MSKKKTNFNIRIKILLILCVVLSVTFIGNFVISGDLFQRSQIDAFDKEAFATARGLQNNIDSLIEKSFLPYTEISNCELLLHDFVDNSEDTLYVYTTDAEGELLYTSKDGVYGAIDKDSLKEYLMSDKEVRIDDKKSNTLYYILPLHDTAELKGQKVVSQVGAMVVAYPRTCITEPINRLYMYNAVLAVVTFIFSFVVIFTLITKWFTEPLQRLDAAIKDVSKTGIKDGSELNINTNDEIGQIAGSFNDMLMQLKVTTVSKDYVDSILENIGEALFVVNQEMRIELVNDAAIKLLGYEPQEIKGKPVDFLYAVAKDELYAKQIKDKIIDNEAMFRTKAGAEVPVSVNWSAITDSDGASKYICTARDVTDIRKAQDILMHHANYDQLTEIPNRYSLEKALDNLINYVNPQHFFVVIDLDKFKPINDTCGHTAGDKVLKQIAYMLENVVGAGNIVARIGGDEFAMIMYNTDVKTMNSRIEKLLTAVRNYSFVWEGKVFKIGMSIGAFEICKTGLDKLTILSSADTACYIAKKNGGNTLHIYHEDDMQLDIKADEKDTMRTIIEALENNRFTIEYNSIIPCCSTNNEYIYDILVKLIGKNGEEISRQHFMPIAERYNKTRQLDRWTLYNFCENYENISNTMDNKPALYNINLSEDSIIDDTFIDYIAKELYSYNIPADRLCFSVKEANILSNFTEVSKLINGLKNLGCKFAIDDFGSGISSYNQLKLMNVDLVRTDESYITSDTLSSVDIAVIKSINDIAHLLEVKTIVSGVDNEQTFNTLKKLGIDYVQKTVVGK